MNYAIGTKFNMLTPIKQIAKARWEFKCDCGSITIKRIYDVISGKTKSCGCLHKKTVQERNRNSATHKLSRTGCYSSWHATVTRCYNKNNHRYAIYGAVGIVMCEFLRSTPENLLSLLGPRPEKHSIDRINNLGSYTCGQCPECYSKNWPLNVRWATRSQQTRNQKTNHMVTISEVTKCIAEWAEISGVSYKAMADRVRRNWPEHRLLSPMRAQ